MNAILVGWIGTALAAIALVAVLTLAALLLPRTVRIVASRLHCPMTGRLADVRVLALDGRDPVCVMSCTALVEPRSVTCGMPCIGGDHREDLGGEERRIAGLAAD